LLDLTCFQQQAETLAVDACVIGDHRQIAHAAVAQRQDQVLRNAAQPETTAHDRHPIGDDSLERGSRARKDFRRTCHIATLQASLAAFYKQPSMQLAVLASWFSVTAWGCACAS